MDDRFFVGETTMGKDGFVSGNAKFDVEIVGKNVRERGESLEIFERKGGKSMVWFFGWVKNSWLASLRIAEEDR